MSRKGRLRIRLPRGNERMNYRELYDFGRQKLKEAGIAEADLDARLLLEEVCATDRNDLLVHAERPVTKEQQSVFSDYIQKRRSRIPLQHILGYQEFMGLRFGVTGDVLVPRQDTETLVEEVMRELQDDLRILDLCTGSGCILLSLLRYSNHCKGTGCDVSEQALEVARSNAKALGLEAEFIRSDLFENITGKYDVIVSNPPYIPTGEIEGLMEEVRDHDPLLALDGGADGLDFYRKIIARAGDYLSCGGRLYFEIGCSQAGAVSELMRAAGYQEVKVLQDLSGLDRVVAGAVR